MIANECAEVAGTNTNGLQRNARMSRLHDTNTKLVVLSNSHIHSTTLNSLVDHLTDQDILVVNNSATIPSSLQGTILRSGELIEIRLAHTLQHFKQNIHEWKIIYFGEGNWREKTEDRRTVELIPGDIISFGEYSLLATVKSVDNIREAHLIFNLEYSRSTLMQKLFTFGVPIQYSYLRDDLEVWDQQTIFSTIPVSVEPPSASFQLTHALIQKLKTKGVQILSLTHSAGLSSTGIQSIDHTLPWTEHYSISPETAELLNQGLAGGKKIVAIGTSVVRALESNYRIAPTFSSGDFSTSLVLGDDEPVLVVDGILSGMHEPEGSHFQLLQQFSSKEQLNVAYQLARDERYLWHEYGDLTLIRRELSSSELK